MNKAYTIGEIQDFHDYLVSGIKNGFIDIKFADDIEERQAWEEVDEMINGYDNNIPGEQGSSEEDFK